MKKLFKVLIVLAMLCVLGLALQVGTAQAGLFELTIVNDTKYAFSIDFTRVLCPMCDSSVGANGHARLLIDLSGRSDIIHLQKKTQSDPVKIKLRATDDSGFKAKVFDDSEKITVEADAAVSGKQTVTINQKN